MFKKYWLIFLLCVITCILLDSSKMILKDCLLLTSIMYIVDMQKGYIACVLNFVREWTWSTWEGHAFLTWNQGDVLWDSYQHPNSIWAETEAHKHSRTCLTSNISRMLQNYLKIITETKENEYCLLRSLLYYWHSKSDLI